MTVSEELVAELHTIIREDYRQELEFQQASLLANGLVGYLDLLAKLHHKHNEHETNVPTE